MADELVSVVIPSYNRPDRTQRAIDSVAAQSYSPIELLVVDDGSSPPLAEELSLPKEQLASANLIPHDENQGANVARNTGIDNASGNYLAFLDSDDEWKSEKIEAQVSKIRNNDGYGVSYTGVKNVDENGRLNGMKYATFEGDLTAELLKENMIGTLSSVLVSRDVIRRSGKLNPQLSSFQDWEWYLRLSKETNFMPVEEPLTIRHNEGGQISTDFSRKQGTTYSILMDSLCEHARTEREQKIAISGLQQQVGYSALLNQQFSDARFFFLRSIVNNPANFKSYLYLLLSGPHSNIARRAKRALIRFSKSFSE